MKMRKKTWTKTAAAIILGTVLAAGCEIIDINRNDGQHDSDRKDDEQEQEEVHSLYYSTVEYDRSYDWKKDELGGMVDTCVKLYKDHEAIVSMDVPAEEHEYVDFESHWILGGDLYTVHKTGGSTVVKKNGKDAFRFGNDDYVTDMVLHKDGIYTLSIPYSGKGWVLRKGEQTVLRQSSGFPVGPLYEDKGDICLTYAIKSESGGNSTGYRYYFTANGHEESLDIMPTVTEILAVRRKNGEINLLQKEANIEGIVWVKEDRTIMLNVAQQYGMRDFGFIVSGNKLLAHAQAKTYRYTESNWNDYFWNESGLLAGTEGDRQIYALCEDGRDLCYISSRKGSSSGLCLHSGARTDMLPEHYFMVSPHALCCNKSKCVLAVNDPQNNNRPVILDGADIVRPVVNGYVTRICLQ